MKLLKKALVIGTAMMMVIPSIASAADIVGYFSNVVGDVLVERNGELLRVANNSAIMSGDKLISWQAGNATVNMNSGCSTTLSSSTFIQLGMGNHCSSIANAAQYKGVASQVANGTQLTTVAGGGAAAGGVASALPLLVVVGGLAGIAAVVSSSDDGNVTPISP